MLIRRKKLIVFTAINRYPTSVGLSYFLYKKQNLFFRFFEPLVELTTAINTTLEELSIPSVSYYF